MNQSFFSLPTEKKDRVLNAGYKTFAAHAYGKASMAFMADEAQISKALLFYYFRNKKELYLYLFRSAADFLRSTRKAVAAGASQDFFEAIKAESRERILMMRRYPYIFSFIARAYYEEDEEVKTELRKLKDSMLQSKKENELSRLDQCKFRNPEDMEVLYDIIIYMSEGYMAKNMNMLYKKPEQIVRDSEKMLDVLKKNFYHL